MKIRLIRKLIIMAPCIILVAAIMTVATPYANAAKKDSLLKRNKNIVAAWLSGGGCAGFSTPNGEEVGIIIIGNRDPIRCVTIANLGRERINLIGINGDKDVLMTVDPDQSKTIMGVEPEPFHELRIMQDGGGGAPGLALWRVGFNPQPEPPRG